MRSERWVRKRLSAFQFFFRACLDKLKTRYPRTDIVLSQVLRMCAENWKKLDDSVKRRFRNEANAANRAKFLSQSRAFSTLSSTKFKLERSRPVFKSQRLLSPFMLFCKDMRSVAMKKHPTYTLGRISKTLADMWMGSGEETKEKYRKLTREKKELQRKRLSASKLKKEIKSGLKKVGTKAQRKMKNKKKR